MVDIQILLIHHKENTLENNLKRGIMINIRSDIMIELLAFIGLVALVFGASTIFNRLSTLRNKENNTSAQSLLNYVTHSEDEDEDEYIQTKHYLDPTRSYEPGNFYNDRN